MKTLIDRIRSDLGKVVRGNPNLGPQGFGLDFVEVLSGVIIPWYSSAGSEIKRSGLLNLKKERELGFKFFSRLSKLIRKGFFELDNRIVINLCYAYAA